MPKLIKNFSLSFLIIYSLVVFSFILLAKKPFWAGDWAQYALMTQSFVNHRTPEFLNQDYVDLQKVLDIKNGVKISLLEYYKMYYFSSFKGSLYCYHFWLYPMFVAPVQQIIHWLGGNELKAFGIFNALLFIGTLLLIYFLYSEDKKKRNLVLFLTAFSPMVPYIIWIHTEVFSACLVTIGLIFYLRQNLMAAILFSALASTQNPPIGFFTIWCGIVYLYKFFLKYRHKNWRDFILTGMCALPLIMSSLFYFINYGCLNLINKVGEAQFKFISWERFASFWCDINQGLICYAALPTLVFFYYVIKNIILRRFSYFSLVVCASLCIVLSSATVNWNSGNSAVMRYTVWIYPFVVFYLSIYMNFASKLLCYALIIGSFAQMIFNDFLLGNCDNRVHGYFSNKILTYTPNLYNPEYEIFIDRTQHTDNVPARYPVVFVDNKGRVRKILTDKAGWENIIQNDGYKVVDNEFYQKKLGKFKKKSFQYINVWNDEIIKYPTKLFINQKINFSDTYGSIDGLSNRESWGRWSDSEEARFRLAFQEMENAKVLIFKVSPFINKKHKELNVDVYGNGHYLTSWKFLHGQPFPETKIYVPKSLIDGNILDLKFKIDNPKSPKELGLSQDSRKLGIGFISVEILNEEEK